MELSAVAAASGPLTSLALARAQPELQQQRAVRTLLEASLDTLVLRTSWGAAELAQLRLAYPRSALLERYAAALAARQGDDSAALAGYDRLLRRDASNLEVQLARATLLERQGNLPEAIEGYTRVFDMAPEDSTGFGA